MMADSQAGIDRIFHALGDPTRRAMLEMLSERPHSVSGLAMPLNITLTAVGQHLQILEDCGLVKTAKVGRVRTCELEPAGFAALEKWIQNCRTIWERRFDRLGELLKEEDE
jgi:DNA-binding transcriptional ArsR family regulator